ncbi:MAG: DUF4340 domain-containing protein [Bryobacteraceae bacterium]
MMRVRGLLIAVIVLAALAAAVYWSNREKKEAENKPSPDAAPKVLSIPQDQFQQIGIAKAGTEALVIRKAGSGNWEMVAPKQWPVDQDAVAGLVSALSSLDSSRVVEEKMSDAAQFGLASPSLEVRILRKDGKTARLLLGDDSPAGGGSFAKVDGDPRVFTIATFNKSSLDKSPVDLRDKRLLTFDQEKLTRVELKAKGGAIEFGKNNQNEWQIIRPEPLRADGGQVEELVRKLKDTRMEVSTDEEAKKAAAAFASAKLVATVRTTDASGTQQLEVRKDKDNNYYAKSSVVEGIQKVNTYTGEGLDKGLDDFRNKKLFDFGFSEPSRVEIRDGVRQSVYQQSGGKWFLAGKQMDAPSVQALVDRLRDLSAIKFLKQGGGSPVLEAAVTFGDGKRTERVFISKQGNSYFARRENEPAIYELDGMTVEDLQKTAGSVKAYQPPQQQKKK